jgi:putative FmdB family regulatory protein
MPIYEYQCDKCHHHLEALQKYNDKPLRECPECGKQSLKRLMSAPRFRLAGSGWYETDFKSDQERKRNLVESGDKSEGATADTGADSKSTDTKAGDTKPAETAPAAKAESPSSSGSNGESSKGSNGESKRRTIVSKPTASIKSAVKAKSRTVAKSAPRKTALRKR